MENPAAQGAHPVTHHPQPVDNNSATHPHRPQNGESRKKTGLFVVLATIILMVGIGITVFVNQQNTDDRQNAQVTNRDSCGNLPTSTLIVFDRSNSMKWQGSDPNVDPEDTAPADEGNSGASAPDADQESADENITIDPGDDTTVLANNNNNNKNKNNNKHVINTKLEQAKEAMRFYVSQVRKDPRNSVGLISFGPKARVDSPITKNYDGVINQISNLKTSQGTCLSCAINLANKQMANASVQSTDDDVFSILANKNKNNKNNGGKNNNKNNNKNNKGNGKGNNNNNRNNNNRNNNNGGGGGNNNNNNPPPNPAPNPAAGISKGTARAIIIVSDGRANRVLRNGKSIRPGGKNDQKNWSKAGQAALNAAVAGYNRHGVPFYTIAIGPDSNRTLMSDIAAKTNGKAYYAPSEAQLQSVYDEISNTIGKSTISGVVFDDKNKNGAKDAGETLLPGWTVKLIPANGTTVQANKNKNNNKNNNNNNGGKNNNKNGGKNKNNNGKGGNNNGKNNNGKKNNKNDKGKNNNNNKNNRKHKNDVKKKKKKQGRTYAMACSPDTVALAGDDIVTIEADVANLRNQVAPGRTVIWSSSNANINIAAENDGLTDDEGMTSIDIERMDPTIPFVGTITGTLEGDEEATCSVTITNGDAQASAAPTGITATASPSGNVTPTDVPGTLYAITDANGKYLFDGLCAGDYIITVVPQPGWTVTLPPGNRYPVTMVPGVPIKDKDFGVTGGPTPTGPTIPPTVTASPSGVLLNATVFMHGIGRAGDNPNPFPPQCGGPGAGVTVLGIPETRCLSNQSPLTANRPMSVEIINTSNTVVASGAGTLVYNPGAGNFAGTVSISTQLPAGSYSVKISSEKYLTKLYPGAITINPGPNNLPVISMVVGDVYTGEDSKNQLDIRDYNAVIGCYTSPTMAAKDCNFLPNQKFLTDLNDDGVVNDFDYNLFIRELSVQFGD